MTKTKIDLYKQHKALYKASRRPMLIDVPAVSYLAIEGQGAPGGDVFADAIGALYATAYTVKMRRKQVHEIDYVVSKLEAQWWTPDDRPFDQCEQSEWFFRLMIRTPEFVPASDVEEAHEVLLDKGKSPLVQQVTLWSMTEGSCVQMLHVGPYDREHETISIMASFAQEQGYTFARRHHELYLSDPRRVPPERLKTLLRHPVDPIMENST